MGVLRQSSFLLVLLIAFSLGEENHALAGREDHRSLDRRIGIQGPAVSMGRFTRTSNCMLKAVCGDQAGEADGGNCICLGRIEENGAVLLAAGLPPGHRLAIEGGSASSFVEFEGEVRVSYQKHKIRRYGNVLVLPAIILVDGLHASDMELRYRVERVASEPSPGPDRSYVATGREGSSHDRSGRTSDRRAAPEGVSRGERVRLLLGSRPIQVEVDGIAMNDALQGQVVGVSRGGVDSPMYGKVVGRGQVVMDDEATR